MKISQISKLANMSVSAVRYYEQQGLIQSKRDTNNYRRYDNEDLMALQFINRCKQSGFTLAETSTLLTIKDNKNEHVCQEAKSLTQSKIKHITKQVDSLNLMLNTLSQLEALCCGGQHSAQFCRIIESLEME